MLLLQEVNKSSMPKFCMKIYHEPMLSHKKEFFAEIPPGCNESVRSRKYSQNLYSISEICQLIDDHYIFMTWHCEAALNRLSLQLTDLPSTIPFPSKSLSYIQNHQRSNLDIHIFPIMHILDLSRRLCGTCIHSTKHGERIPFRSLCSYRQSIVCLSETALYYSWRPIPTTPHHTRTGQNRTHNFERSPIHSTPTPSDVGGLHQPSETHSWKNQVVYVELQRQS